METHTTEEKLNAFTHNVGAGLSIGGLIFLLYLTREANGTAMHYVSFSLYGAFQILLYLSSGLTHMFTDKPHIHGVIRMVDQASIYLLIAGTYTPIALITLRGPWGWSIFGIIWGMALIGIVVKLAMGKQKNLLSDLFYLPMGWTIIIAVKPLTAAAPKGMLMWIAIGSLCYTLGIVFYVVKKIPFSHVIWHLFVLGGSIGFYMGFVKYLI